MRHLFLAVILACASMQASALVVDPQKEPAPSTKSVKQKTVSTAPTKAMLAPPSKASFGFSEAALNANYDMMTYYIGQGADINCLNCAVKGKTPVFFALIRSNIELSEWLVQHGANVNIPEFDSGRTPLMSAASSVDQTIINFLLKHGANISATDNEGRTALHYIGTFPGSAHGQDYTRLAFMVIGEMLSNGLNINHQDKAGTTALMNAANQCADASVKFLLSNQAKPELKNIQGQTALDIAIAKATNSGQGATCNNTVKLLQNPTQASSAYPAQQGNSGSTAPNSAPQNSAFGAYAGNYSGNYGGDDNGPFQVIIEQDGNIKLAGKSLRNNQAFTGNGKMNRDGSLGITLGSISTGATFQGSINPKTGALYGTWKNGEQAGNFSGSRQTAQTQAANPIEAIGGLLNVLNKVLTK